MTHGTLNKKMNEKKLSVDYKRIVYTLSMVLLCAVAFTRAAGGGDWWNLAVSCLGFCLFPIVVARFGIKNFLKIPYLIWLVISIPVASVIIYKYYYSALHRMAFAAWVIECVFYGLILIRIITLYIKKEMKSLFEKRNYLFSIAIGFFIWSTISVNKAIWPLFYGIFFYGFFLAPSDEKDNECLFVSVCDSLIIAFFVIQSFAFLHRPYDQLRYVGAFTNSNVNGMFYYCVYLGWLGKYLYLQKNEKPKALRVIHFLFACAMWSFVLLTISRSSLLAFFLTTIVFLLLGELMILKKGFLKGFLLKGICMLCVFALSFPLVFVCVRYIPALRHHPIWITEYSEDFVHSFDPWNSEKYTELNEFGGYFFERFDFNQIDTKGGMITEENTMDENQAASRNVSERNIETIIKGVSYEASKEISSEKTEVLLEIASNDINLDEEILSTDSAAEPVVVNGTVISYPDSVRPGTDEAHPAYTYEEYKGLEKILGIRKYIWGYYLRNIMILGCKEEYPTAFILPWYRVPHAHNSYLQITYCFGIPSGLLFIGISLYSLIFSFAYTIKNKDKTPWYFVFVNCVHFGVFLISLTENIAFPGKMLFSLFFITLLPLMIGKINVFKNT